MYSNVFLEERTYANFVCKSDWGLPQYPDNRIHGCISLRENLKAKNRHGDLPLFSQNRSTISRAF
ncbi:hypothetical protein ABTD35_19540, partial [Acinetobacter baumannii]